MSKKSSELLPINPFGSVRFILQDYKLNLAPFFTPERFTDAFITLIGCPCYLLTQCGTYFPLLVFFDLLSTHSLVFTALSKLRKVIKNLPFSAFGFGFFGTVTKSMMTAIIESPDSNSDFVDSDTAPPSCHSRTTVSPRLKLSKFFKNKPLE